MWEPIPEVKEYNFQYKLQSQTRNWTKIITNETILEINELLPNTTYKLRVKDIPGGNTIARGDFTTLPRTGMQVY